jgi:hypothetical protein
VPMMGRVDDLGAVSMSKRFCKFSPQRKLWSVLAVKTDCSSSGRSCGQILSTLPGSTGSLTAYPRSWEVDGHSEPFLRTRLPSLRSERLIVSYRFE